MSSFFEEIRKGDPKGIAAGMILAEEQTGDPNALVDLNGGMSMAAKGGSLSLVQLMHAKMKKRGVRVKSYNWAIDCAASVGAVVIVDWLLEQAKTDKVQIDAELPMWAAAWGGHIGLVKKFVAMGARTFNSALFQAAWAGKLHMVLYLIVECGADDWEPALRHFSDPEVLRELWDHNPNLFLKHGLVRPPACPSRTPKSTPSAPANPPNAEPTPSSGSSASRKQ